MYFDFLFSFFVCEWMNNFLLLFKEISSQNSSDTHTTTVCKLCYVCIVHGSLLFYLHDISTTVIWSFSPLPAFQILQVCGGCETCMPAIHPDHPTENFLAPPLDCTWARAGWSPHPPRPIGEGAGDQSRFPSSVWNPPLKSKRGTWLDRCAKPLFCLHETPREKAYVKSFLTNQLLLTRTGSCTPLAFSLKQDLTSVFIGYKTNLILPFLNFEVYLSLNWQDETQLECPSFPH